VNANTGIELGHDTQPQLYDLENDLGEKRNVTAEHPETVKEMAALLQKIKDDRRTRP
jgi:hypothetical protein